MFLRRGRTIAANISRFHYHAEMSSVQKSQRLNSKTNEELVKTWVPFFSNRELNIDQLNPLNRDNSASGLQSDNKVLEVFFGKPDCGEGGPDRPLKSPCDPPEGPCKPRGKAGYPPKPRPVREPFCVTCPAKEDCNLNRCPETEGTSRAAFREIAFTIYSQSQRHHKIDHRKLGGIHVRNYGILTHPRLPQSIQSRLESGKPPSPPKKPETCIKKSKEPENSPKFPCKRSKSESPCAKSIEKPQECSASVKIAYQQCPDAPKLPKMPECIVPPSQATFKCPPLPEVPKPPLCSKGSSTQKPKDAPICKENMAKTTQHYRIEKPPEGFWGQIVACMNKRKMSTDVKRFSSDSRTANNAKCKTIAEMCAKNSRNSKCGKQECSENQKTSCYPNRSKCPEVKSKEAVVEAPIIEKIDYSKTTCEPPKFGKLGPCPKPKTSRSPLKKCVIAGDGMTLLNDLPAPPSKPVVLCQCSPPVKLHPGACPCASETPDPQSANSTQPCPPKPKYPCPESRTYHCPLKPISPPLCR